MCANSWNWRCSPTHTRPTHGSALSIEQQHPVRQEHLPFGTAAIPAMSIGAHRDATKYPGWSIAVMNSGCQPRRDRVRSLEAGPITAREHCQLTEVLSGRLGRLRHSGTVQTTTDDLSDPLERHTRLGDRMERLSIGTVINGEPKGESSGESMHRRPAIEPVSRGGGHPFLTCDRKEQQHEATRFAEAMHRGREPNDRRAHTPRRQRNDRLLRCAEE